MTHFVLIIERVISIPGDITISSLFNVHEYNERARYENNWFPCGKIQPQVGIMYIEAMLFALDKINRNSSFLHGAKLAAKIMDYCGDRLLLRNSFVRAIGWSSRGLIGPQHSDESIVAAVVMDLRFVTVISYAATSPELEDRNKYRRFFRTVPSDRNQVKVMIDLAVKLNWTYVSVIYSYGSYGEKAAWHFKMETSAKHICIPILRGLPQNVGQKHIRETFSAIVKIPKIKVVYLFLRDTDTKKMLKVMNTMKSVLSSITFVASDGWGGRVSITKGVEEGANGALTVQQHAHEVREFKDYFLALSPLTNKRNIWFSEFWQYVFKCNFTKSKGINGRICSGKEKLAPGRGYYENTPVLTVINAVYAYAHVFRKIIEQRCVRNNISAKVCVRNRRFFFSPRSRLDIYYKLKSLKFVEPFQDRIFAFDKYGSLSGGYDILNFRKNNKSQGYVYSKVGEWQKESEGKRTLAINLQNISWKGKLAKPPTSVCSSECKLGNIVSHKHESKCCWDCMSCDINARIFNNSCIPCGLDYVPDSFRKTCRRLPDKFFGTRNPVVQGLLSLIILELLLTFSTAGIFLKNFNTRIVRTSSRELCLVMLVGIIVTQIAPMIFIIRPSAVVCGMQRIIIGYSFSLCYAPLLLKLNRIYRIFKYAKLQIEPPAMVSSRSQILLSLGLSSISLLVSIASIIGQKPKISKEYPSHRRYVVLHCQVDLYTILFSLMYSSALMLLSSFFAFKTRNFPKNYNETKIIGFTVYTTCLILAFILPSFFFVNDPEGKYKTIILSFTCEAIAAVNLFGLFGHKIFLLVTPGSTAGRPAPVGTINHIMNSSDILSARLGINPAVANSDICE